MVKNACAPRPSFCQVAKVAEMASELQQFEALVGELLSPQNDVRNQAEVDFLTITTPEALYFG